MSDTSQRPRVNNDRAVKARNSQQQNNGKQRSGKQPRDAPAKAKSARTDKSAHPYPRDGPRAKNEKNQKKRDQEYRAPECDEPTSDQEWALVDKPECAYVHKPVENSSILAASSEGELPQNQTSQNSINFHLPYSLVMPHTQLPSSAPTSTMFRLMRVPADEHLVPGHAPLRIDIPTAFDNLQEGTTDVPNGGTAVPFDPLVIADPYAHRLPNTVTLDGRVVVNFKLDNSVLTLRPLDNYKPAHLGGEAIVSFIPTSTTGDELRLLALDWFDDGRRKVERFVQMVPVAHSYLEYDELNSDSDDEGGDEERNSTRYARTQVVNTKYKDADITDSSDRPLNGSLEPGALRYVTPSLSDRAVNETQSLRASDDHAHVFFTFDADGAIKAAYDSRIVHTPDELCCPFPYGNPSNFICNRNIEEELLYTDKASPTVSTASSVPTTPSPSRSPPDSIDYTRLSAPPLTLSTPVSSPIPSLDASLLSESMKQRVADLLARIQEQIAEGRSRSPSSTEASDGSSDAGRREDSVEPFDGPLTVDEVRTYPYFPMPELLAATQIRAAQALVEFSASQRTSPAPPSVTAVDEEEARPRSPGHKEDEDVPMSDDWPAQWIVDFGDCEHALLSDAVSPPAFFRGTYVTDFHIPPPVPHHLRIRQIMMQFFHFVSNEVLSLGINEFLNDVLYDWTVEDSDEARDLIAQYFLPGPEWCGNPFLYAVERLRLRQAAFFIGYLDDVVSLDDSPLLATIYAILNFHIDGPDAATIPQQRMAGMYGLPGNIPRCGHTTHF